MKKWKQAVLVASLGVLLFGCVMGQAQSLRKVNASETTTVSEDTEEESLAFTKTKKKLKVGKSYKFKVNKSGATFSVSNKKLAKISKSGKLTAKNYGTVKVIAKVGDEKVTYKVKILPIATVGIDPGHQSKGNNGKEPVGPGSSTMKTKVAGGTSGVSSKKAEYQLTMEVANVLKAELKSRGYKVVMTRSSNDVDISNKERAELLNEKCDIAIRLHADGASSSSVSGASALYPSTSNPYVGYLSDKSKTLSECVLNSYCSATGIRNRGLSQRDDLTGTNWSTIPVTLIEMGFMTNSSDDLYMANSDNQQAMAEGIADGVDAYYGR